MNDYWNCVCHWRRNIAIGGEARRAAVSKLGEVMVIGLLPSSALQCCRGIAFLQLVGSGIILKVPHRTGYSTMATSNALPHGKDPWLMFMHKEVLVNKSPFLCELEVS